ncbi:MAG: hypothetical protein JWO67_6568 [Streptosporangiaceae bacterium]|nr:hypothetical protein [Streptosporangiaceae bacterium]
MPWSSGGARGVRGAVGVVGLDMRAGLVRVVDVDRPRVRVGVAPHLPRLIPYPPSQCAVRRLVQPGLFAAAGVGVGRVGLVALVALVAGPRSGIVGRGRWCFGQRLAAGTRVRAVSGWRGRGGMGGLVSDLKVQTNYIDRGECS